MANRKPNQDSKEALIGRLMLAMRRSSAAGVLHGQAIAKRVGVNSSDLECLDLILLNGPSTAGDIARRTGLTSGAVTGLIDRLERLGLVERTADAQDRRKVLVRVREDKIAPIGELFAPTTAGARIERQVRGIPRIGVIRVPPTRDAGDGGVDAIRCHAGLERVPELDMPG